MSGSRVDFYPVSEARYEPPFPPPTTEMVDDFEPGDASAADYRWVVLNRMSDPGSASTGATYYYRADGQWVEEIEGPTLKLVNPSTQSKTISP